MSLKKSLKPPKPPQIATQGPPICPHEQFPHIFRPLSGEGKEMGAETFTLGCCSQIQSHVLCIYICFLTYFNYMFHIILLINIRLSLTYV